MIDITYQRASHSLSVKGHAQCDAKGRDLLCAAVSALVLTAAANVSDLALQGCFEEHAVSLADGNAQISCTPSEKYRAVVTLVLDTLCTGFRLLRDNYPDKLTFNLSI